jgi:hypothetical protein
LAEALDASRRSSAKARLSGIPAASRFASSRVNDSTARLEMRPVCGVAVCAAAARFAASASSRASSIRIACNPCRPICATAAARVSAVSVPLLRRPSLLMAT